ncbi:uncharacterized protein LOC107841283 [Capsicum annuum]|uniref:uncharacterized protein LOC107841283 n=1 Tax=Capsicum annuum TaxID=4072 RepID=UPI001FB0DF96|nr:uncharacterized protein LOC107841283 [Capsicum annuum]
MTVMFFPYSTRSGITTIVPPLPAMEVDDDETPIEKSKKATGGDDAVAKENDLSLNTPLLEELGKMPRYARFMNQLVTKKKGATIKDANGFHHCSAVTMKALLQKKCDPRAFTIPFTIGSSQFTRSLCDLGANINLMLLAIFKQLGFNPPKLTSMQLLMAGCMVNKPIGISFNVIVRVDNLIFLADFVILNSELDTEMSIILGRPFMATVRPMVDIEKGEMIFRVNSEEATFNI